MPAIAKQIGYGFGIILLEDPKIRRRRDGLDGGNMKYLTQLEDSFLPGGADPLYPGMEIEEVESVQASETDWEHSLMTVGVRDLRPARRELGYPQISKMSSGFDEASDSIITKTPDDYDRGVVMAGNVHMICVDSPRTNIYGAWWRVQPRYNGIIGSRPYKRQITVNEDIVSPQVPITISLSGGWGTPAKGQVSFPKIVVRDSNVVTVASPTASIPGNLTPPSPPDIQSITIITGDPSILTLRWPNHWKIASLDRDEIPGTTIALETITYEFVWPAMFG